MSIVSTTSFTERIKFFDGQRLFASDLQFLEQSNREMRWLHNRSLHQAGIGSGFGVSGGKGDRQIRIEPGYAIDAEGREIVLTQPEVLQVPPVANDGHGNPVYYDLAVSYRDTELTESETRDGVCVPRSAVRLRETPVFCWVELVPKDDAVGPKDLLIGRQAKLDAVNRDLESGKRIRLARAEVLNCQLNRPLSLAQRRNAKPAVQPFLYAGRTKEQTNAWNAKADGPGISISIKVDTSAAPFRSEARYFAHAVGNREVEVTLPGRSQKTKLILDGFPRVQPITVYEPINEKFVGFELSLLIPQILFDRIAPATVATALQQTARSAWYVEWLGIEG